MYKKYLKYKTKYLNLDKGLIGGNIDFDNLDDLKDMYLFFENYHIKSFKDKNSFEDSLRVDDNIAKYYFDITDEMLNEFITKKSTINTNIEKIIKYEYPDIISKKPEDTYNKESIKAEFKPQRLIEVSRYTAEYAYTFDEPEKNYDKLGNFYELPKPFLVKFSYSGKEYIILLNNTETLYHLLKFLYIKKINSDANIIFRGKSKDNTSIILEYFNNNNITNTNYNDKIKNYNKKNKLYDDYKNIINEFYNLVNIVNKYNFEKKVEDFTNSIKNFINNYNSYDNLIPEIGVIIKELEKISNECNCNNKYETFFENFGEIEKIIMNMNNTFCSDINLLDINSQTGWYFFDLESDNKKKWDEISLYMMILVILFKIKNYEDIEKLIITPHDKIILEFTSNNTEWGIIDIFGIIYDMNNTKRYINEYKKYKLGANKLGLSIMISRLLYRLIVLKDTHTNNPSYEISNKTVKIMINDFGIPPINLSQKPVKMLEYFVPWQLIVKKYMEKEFGLLKIKDNELNKNNVISYFKNISSEKRKNIINEYSITYEDRVKATITNIEKGLSYHYNDIITKNSKNIKVFESLGQLDEKKQLEEMNIQLEEMKKQLEQNMLLLEDEFYSKRNENIIKILDKLIII